MEQVAISEFKAKCLAIVKEVQRTGVPVQITRHGKPVAELGPPTPPPQGKSWLGNMRGTAKILGDIVGPIIDMDDIEALR